MHDALATTAKAAKNNPVVGTVSFQGAEHLLSQRVSKRTLLTDRRHDVINSRHGALRAPHRQTLVLQSSESLRAGDLMDQMQTHK